MRAAMPSHRLTAPFQEKGGGKPKIFDVAQEDIR